MIDLTPLDVRNKRGDFKRLMRGYDPQEVDVFLEIAAERLEQLTRENIQLLERAQTLQHQVDAQTDREQAVQEALVTAQELRADIRGQAQREAEGIMREAETEARRIIAEAEAEARTKLRSSERRLDHISDSLQEMERRRARFLKEFRQLLEREMDVVVVEEERQPLEDRTIDLELGGRRTAGPAGGVPRTEAAALPASSPTEVASDSPEAPAPGGEAGPPEPETSEETLPFPTLDEPPPPDAPVDELAAAYEQALSVEPKPQGSQPLAPPTSPSAMTDEAPPTPQLPRSDNLLLYLDPDDEV